MKKINKWDLLNCFILLVSFLFLIFITVYPDNYYGSKVDWISQHFAFPDYFRSLFYKTGDLLPDFAFNIGNGQNIFNFSYYGLLSPIILISYLFPFWNMISYVSVSIVIECLVSSFLVYFWVKGKGYSRKISFLSAFMFLFASSITFHSHRHIMFINYMPFLIMGLYGIDKSFKMDKHWLLVLSITLMCLTSYYYSVGGLVVLAIYWIYVYLKNTENFEIKKFALSIFKTCFPVIIGVLMSSLLLVPTFLALLNGRSDTLNVINYNDLFAPQIHLDFFLYYSYGLGLSAIVLPALYFFFNKRKENIFLGTVLVLPLFFGIFTYLLNGFMYLDGKVLIPFLPIYILVIAEFIKNIFDCNIDIKKFVKVICCIFILIIGNGYYSFICLFDLLLLLFLIMLYKKFNKKLIIIVPLCILSFLISLVSNYTDEYVVKEEYDHLTNSLSSSINYITNNDNSYYRINTFINGEYNNNILGNINCYLNTVYSSLSNLNYNNFYYDVLNNNIQSRNRAILSNTSNIITNMIFSNKYMITKAKKDYIGYEMIQKIDDMYIYQNNNVLPYAYASGNVVSSKCVENLEYPYNTDILVKYLVVDEGTSCSNVTSSVVKKEIDISNFDFNGVSYSYDKGVYSFDIEENENNRIYYNLDDEDKNKILFIRFNVGESNKDIYISINGNKNKLTEEGWKYHNGNYTFDYVIAINDLKRLNIKFSEGHFDISDIEFYTLDYDEISNIGDSVDALNITSMSSNTLIGNINVSNDGYFTTSIAYDNGFKAYVDSEEVDIDLIDGTFVGFKISEGYHDIKIVYTAPGKKLGIILSIISLFCYVILIIIERRHYY